MQGDPAIISMLNDVLTAELTAINQYFIHAKMCSNWGYERLAEHSREESIEEMKHADEIIERILFFDGVPNMQRLNPVRVGETVPEQFQLDLELEYDAVKRFNDGIAACVAASDNTTRALLERSSSRGRPHRLARDPARGDPPDRRSQLPGAAAPRLGTRPAGAVSCGCARCRGRTSGRNETAAGIRCARRSRPSTPPLRASRW